MGKQTSYLISAGDGRIRRNACGLLPLTSILGILILIASQQNLSAETIPTLIEGDKVALEKASEPSTEVLLAHLLPTNSCPNTLKNLKFAVENKLFTAEELYTEANVKKLLGDQSEVRFQGEFGGTYANKSQYFEERAKQKNRKQHHLEVFSRPSEDQLEKSHLPCFHIAHFQHSVYQDKDRNNKPYRSTTAYFTLGFAAMGKKNHDTNIKQFIAAFGTPQETLPVLGDRHPPHLPNGEIAKFEKSLKRLFYQSKKENYRYFMYATANKAGTILTIRIETSLEE